MVMFFPFSILRDQLSLYLSIEPGSIIVKCLLNYLSGISPQCAVPHKELAETADKHLEEDGETCNRL
jgi:hypothetical protein